MRNKSDDTVILELSIEVLTKALDELLTECMDEGGSPVVPSKQAVGKARGYMPKKYRSSYQHREALT